MICFHSKLKLKPINKEDFHQIIQTLHHLRNFPISPLTEMENGKIVSFDDLLAYHVEDGTVYEYIYHEQDHQLVITIDKRNNEREISLLDYLISHDYLDLEDDLPSSFQPTWMKDSRQLKQIKTSLPIVYVSLQYLSNESIHDLSNQLKGMAYVTYGNEKCNFAHLYQKDEFNFKKSKNMSEMQFMQMIFDQIQSYMTKRVFDYPYIFGELNKVAINQMIEDELVKEAEVSQNYGNLIHELKMKKIALLNQQAKVKEDVDRLAILIELKKNYLNTKNAHPLILKGDEVELYEGEHKDLLLQLIEEELARLNGMEHYQERINILERILSQKGNEEIGVRRQLLAVYLEVFGENKRSLSDKDKGMLKRHGFYIFQEGKHPKTFFFGDRRYEITASSSASDKYAGNQNFRQIRSDIF